MKLARHFSQHPGRLTHASPVGTAEYRGGALQPSLRDSKALPRLGFPPMNWGAILKCPYGTGPTKPPAHSQRDHRTPARPFRLGRVGHLWVKVRADAPGYYLPPAKGGLPIARAR